MFVINKYPRFVQIKVLFQSNWKRFLKTLRLKTESSRKKHILKAKYFKYPSKRELKYANTQCPKFDKFGFKPKSEIVLVLNGVPMEEASRIDNLFWWDLALKNRFGSLRGAFFDSIIHYRRGFKEDYWECTRKEMATRILFDNNAEIFYYLFFVSVDVIAQILNLYFNLNLSERAVGFNRKLINIITDPNVNKALDDFFEETKVARKYRHRFTHRYPTNYPDHRSRIELKGKKTVLHGGSGTYIQTNKIVDNMEKSLSALSDLMNSLKPILR